MLGWSPVPSVETLDLDYMSGPGQPVVSVYSREYGPCWVRIKRDLKTEAWIEGSKDPNSARCDVQRKTTWYWRRQSQRRIPGWWNPASNLDRGGVLTEGGLLSHDNQRIDLFLRPHLIPTLPKP